MRPAGFLAAGELIADRAVELGAEAVGGPVMAAIPLACAAIAVPDGAGLVGFFVRKEGKAHGLQRMVEGPVEAGTKVLVVEDTVTTGGSTIAAIEQIRDQGLDIVGGPCLVDRLAGGTDAIAAAIGGPFDALVTIDEIYPERPDRAWGGRVRIVAITRLPTRAESRAAGFALAASTAVIVARWSRRRAITETFWSTPSRDLPVP